YHGNQDVYIIPVLGGVPKRITYQSFSDRMVDWHPNGEQILFASRRMMGQRSANQFFLVSKNGGLPEKLAIPYGELASYSPDGKQLAYITKITENYPFKRYRGGLASDILIFDLESRVVRNITNNHANDGKPAWAGDIVYFLSDQADDMRLNVWAYDSKQGSARQITKFKDFDISFLSAGPKELVFEAGGELYMMDLATQVYRPVQVNVISDLSAEIPRSVNVENRIQNMTAAPGGKRIVFEARGELFNVPVKDGYTINLTQSSGAFDREPAWSPDGKLLACWSDRSGENEIYLHDTQGKAEPRKLTNRGAGYGYALYWSPDSEWISFIDEKNDIYIVETESGTSTKVANTLWNLGHGSRHGYPINWSPDSKWITFALGAENANSAIFIYDVENKLLQQITSSFYNDVSPVFGAEGKYLFYRTDRNFAPHYSDMGDGTWVYPNATQIAAIALTEDVPSLFTPKNDALEIKEENEENNETEKEKEPSGDKDSASEKDKDDLEVKIDFEDMETRLMLLPARAGNIGNLFPFKGKLLYQRFPNTGSENRTSSLILYDMDKREEETVMEDVGSAALTADGKALLVSSRRKYGIIKPMPGQKIKDAIPTNGLVMDLVPKEEWHQLFIDAWRRHRDFFYDPNMHGLDWAKLREQYGALVEDARTRWDVTNIMSNLAAELSAGHTYTFGGDVERVSPSNTGYLGIDWELGNNNLYKIGRIVQPAVWDTEIRSPFDQPGVPIEVGDYIHSVNGVTLDPTKDPYAAFTGLSGQTVSLVTSKNGNNADAKQYIIKCMSQGEESRLRYLEWIENNRKMVEDLSDGKLGYVYMSNTSGRGQLELVRMFYGQL
ncbi:MAG: PD40 domain-containing protein, partial [Bacteroidia bacterium]|nr:PD40 domain-containing protein [Bacteroidia bacterium]